MKRVLVLACLLALGCGSPDKPEVQEPIGPRVVEHSQYGGLGWETHEVMNTGDQDAFNVRVCISCATWPQDYVYQTTPANLRPGGIGKVTINTDRATSIVWIRWD